MVTLDVPDVSAGPALSELLADSNAREVWRAISAWSCRHVI